LIIKNDCAKDITVLLNTNGTLYNKKFLDLLIQFKSVTLCISIDDLEHRLEYERYPTEWNTILENIAKFKALASTHTNIFLTLCPTVSIFNVYYLPEYLVWAKSTGIWIYFNILHYRPCYSIKNLPPMLKEIVLTRIPHKEFSEIRNFLNLECEDDKLIYEFIENTKSFDSIRGQSFNETFGIWGELITGYADE